MKLSVLICTCNGEKYIEKQLLSIINQSLPVNEIKIYDDKSEDKTYHILERFANNYPHLITIYQNEKRLGTKKNFEAAIKLCNSDFYFLSDQDDLWENVKVEMCINAFNKNPDMMMLFTNGLLIDSNDNPLDGKLWDKWGFNKKMKMKWKNNFFAFDDLINNNNKVTGATIVFRDTLKKEIFPFILPIDYWHDAWLALHASGNNALFFLDSCLIKYRIHPDQQIGITLTDRIKYDENDHFSKSFFLTHIKKKYKFHYLFFKVVTLVSKIIHR
ncbi:glycosyltransferase [Pedobacter sp. R20-19]|uniref:glycosyltransferase n=1 Tax=Pedobacter sp. R20-19 TaxID=1270196 RepID=UPI000692284E|nr:glycosyltransferase [Pedobacter sp. R20-19]